MAISKPAFFAPLFLFERPRNPLFFNALPEGEVGNWLMVIGNRLLVIDEHRLYGYCDPTVELIGRFMTLAFLSEFR